MKIAIIRTSVIPQKIENYNNQEIGLGRELVNRGISVDYYCATSGNRIVMQNIYQSDNAVLNLIQLPTKKIIAQNGLFSGLFKLLRKGSYDLIQVSEYDNITSFLVIFWSLLFRRRVFIYQGMYRNYTGKIERLLQAIYDHIAVPIIRRCVENVMCKTISAYHFMKSKGFYNLRICHVGLDEVKIKDINSNIIKNDIDLLYIGTIESGRNPMFLLEVLRIVKNNKPNVKMVIIGKGLLWKQMKKKITEYNLENNIQRIAEIPQSQIGSIYQRSKIFLLPSSYEIYGMVILESMYYGLSIISSDTAGAREIIDDGIDGIILPLINAELWGRQVLELLDDPKKRSAISYSAKNKIKSNYLWHHTANDFILAYSLNKEFSQE